MSPKKTPIAKLTVLALALGAVPALPPQAAAQGTNVERPGGPLFQGPPPIRPRIEIYPQRPLYRRCVDWYELQNRPSGQVLFPQMRCWWVRG